MDELSLGSPHVVDHAHELQDFFLQVGRETVLHEEGRCGTEVVNEDARGLVRMVLEYRTAIVYDETVYPDLVLGSLHILHGSLPLSWDLCQ